MLTPEDPRALLRALEQGARKRFGQHFLSDVSVVHRMVRGARVGADDRVVEVGPGLGILTEALLATGCRLVAVELDRDLAAFLRSRHPSLRLVEADALQVDYADLLGAFVPVAGEPPRAKVVANLPYNVGTTLVMRLLRLPELFQSVTVMLQYEVVERLMAIPGTKAYNALSVEAQARARPVFLLELPPEAFHPPPKVRSAVVRLDLFDRARTGASEGGHFDEVVRAAFRQRRKTIHNSLGAVYGRERAHDALVAAGIDPRARAESLALESFWALAEHLGDPPTTPGEQGHGRR